MYIQNTAFHAALQQRISSTTKKCRIKSSLNRVLCIQLKVIQFDIIKTENHISIS